MNKAKKQKIKKIIDSIEFDVGDKVYEVSDSGDMIEEATIKEIVIKITASSTGENDIKVEYVIGGNVYDKFNQSELGKRFFVDRKEAEKAAERQKKEYKKEVERVRFFVLRRSLQKYLETNSEKRKLNDLAKKLLEEIEKLKK